MVGKINEIMYDDFTVIDPATSARITGITSTGFTTELYNSSGAEVSGSIHVSVAELGNGNYRLSYTPTAKGLWNVTLFHSTYFPAGKTANHQIYNVDIDNVYTNLGTVDDKVDALITSTGYISTTANSVLSRVNSIPTNPMLNSEDGSSFTNIPDMAKESTLLSIYTSTGNALTAGFNAGAKQATLLEVQTSTGHISETVDTLVISVSEIPTNPMLNNEDGSSFNSIPDMALDSTVAKEDTLSTVDNKIDELITSTGHISEVVDTIPTNPMLDSEDGSSFDNIPDMAKESTVLSAYTSTGNVLTSGFSAGAKETTLLAVQTSTGYISDSVDTLKSDTTTIQNNQVIIEDKIDDLITSTGHISEVVDELDIDIDLLQTIYNDLEIVDGKVDELITSTGNIRSAVSAIPTNPMLDTATGITFTAIPDMALNSTVAKDATVAKEATLNTVDDKVDELITSTGHISEVVDAIESILGGIYFGDNTVTITVKNTHGVSLGDASVQLWGTDLTNLVTYGYTDSNGQIIRTANDGNYKIKVRKNGYSFEGTYDLAIFADVSEEYIGNTFTPDPPAEVTQCRIYGYIIDASGENVEGAIVQFMLAEVPSVDTSTGSAISADVVQCTTDENGYFYQDLLRNTEFVAIVQQVGIKERIRIPDEEFKDLFELLGLTEGSSTPQDNW